MTTFSKEAIEKELKKKGTFSLAYVQKEFGVGYERAKYIVAELLKAKKIQAKPDGLNYVFESPLKKAKDEKDSSGPFSRFFNRRKATPPEKITELEIEILTAIYKNFNVDIAECEAEHSYSMLVTDEFDSTTRVLLDFYEDRFRIHDGRHIMDSYGESLNLESAGGTALMNQIMSQYPALSTSNDGAIGAVNITADNVTNVTLQLCKLIKFMEKINDPEDALKNALEELNDARVRALSFLAIQANSREIEKAKAYIECSIEDDDFDSEEQDAAADLLLYHLKEKTSSFSFSSFAGACLLPRLRKFKYVPKE